jgi:superfamily II DNA or RNA helicase
MKARECRQIPDELANRSPDAEPLLMVGTSSFIGEGLDCPALDTVFLAAPITFKNRLVQYIGQPGARFLSDEAITAVSSSW